MAFNHMYSLIYNNRHPVDETENRAHDPYKNKYLVSLRLEYQDFWSRWQRR